MIRPKLEHKILLIIVAGLVCGLGFSVIVTIKRESDNLVEQYRMRSLLFGDTLMAGFRNVMLAGRAGYIEQLVADARAEFRDFGELLLFDDRGEEIFEKRGRFVSQPAGEPRVAAVLRQRRAETFQPTRISPLLNDPACQRCHGEAAAVRGATWLSLGDLTGDGEAPGARSTRSTWRTRSPPSRPIPWRRPGSCGRATGRWSSRPCPTKSAAMCATATTTRSAVSSPSRVTASRKAGRRIRRGRRRCH